MTLTLTVLRCPDASAPETRVVRGGEFSIGRGPDNDWVLPDPERHLSKRHCVLAFRGGGWQVAGTSSNGTYLVPGRSPGADPGQPLEELGPQPVADGDRLVLGPYEIELRLTAAAGADPFAGLNRDPFAPGDPFRSDPLAAGPPDADPFGPDPLGQPPAWPSGGASRPRAAAQDDPFGEDPFAPPARPAGPGWGAAPGASAGADPWPGVLPAAREAPSPGLPPGLGEDPFAPPPRRDGAAQADHSPAVGDAFRPSPVRPSGPSPVLPDDWDLDLAAPAPAPPAAAPPIPPPAALAPPPPPPVPAPPAAAPDHPVAASPPAAAPGPAAGPDASEAALLAAFLRGAGLEGVPLDDPVARMERLGAAFRALVAGLRQALIARASIKGEFRIGQTMVRTRGNNPLKFSADDDDALAALLGTGRRADMGAPEAITDALADMRHHELATVAAMQGAVRALLARFAPAGLRGAEGGLRLPGAARARAWEAFEALHAEVTRGLSDDFDSVFGKSFARAYEQAMQDLSEREGRR